jgi:hypothetical protein
MKKWTCLALIGLGLGIGIATFAEEAAAVIYDRTEASRLYNIYREKNTAKTPDAAEAMAVWKDYVINAAINEDAADNYAQLLQLIPDRFTAAKVAKPTALQINDKIDELWKADYDPSNRKEALYVALCNRYILPDAIVKVGNEELYNNQLWSSYHRDKQYDKALALAVKYERWSNALNTANAMKDRAKIFEYGKKVFLDTFITTPAAATQTLTTILRPNYAGIVDNAEIADFLKAIADRYPAPDANVEDWKGFMGFVGYRYKSLTGQDLFKK